MLFKISTVVILVSSAMVQALPASLTQRAPLAQVITKCTVPNTAALTFDDGPFSYIRDISEQLIAAGGKGTFFWNGNNFRCIYDQDSVERVKYAYGAGHMVASHTWRHADLATLNADQITSEMQRVDEALQRLLGVTPAFMRPPYGSYNDLVREIAGERGQTIVLWDFDSGDSRGSTEAQIEQVYDALAGRHPSNVLALNHEIYGQISDSVRHAIQALTGAGYNLVTVAECLGMEPYLSVGAPESGSWTC